MAEGIFHDVREDVSRYDQLLAAMQRLRGRLYLQDGAIRQEDLTTDGRHVCPADRRGWHLLCLDPHDDREVLGCARWLLHDPFAAFGHLQLQHAAIAQCQKWGRQFRSAVEGEIQAARRSGVSYVEVGGWALDERVRGTTEALRSAVATFAWTRLIGGALAIGTVTRRNGSASILRRMGGQSLTMGETEIPPYFDPRYNCEMEVLRFDSRLVNPRYEDLTRNMESEMTQARVVTAQPCSASFAAAA